MTDLRYGSRLENIIRSDKWSMEILETVRTLNLPDWAIGAGFVRALVWDRLSGKSRTLLEDVDVLYFDSSDLSQKREKQLEDKLLKLRPDVPWSVKNQARMHFRNHTDAYHNTEDALRFWLETPTAVAIRIALDGQFTLMAPYGLNDLFQMIIRPTPAARTKMEQFDMRLSQKPWQKIWPRIKVIRETVH